MTVLAALSKLRIIGLSNLHSVLDKVIDLNSPGAVEQYIRDLEGSSRTLDQEISKAIAGGRTKNAEKVGKVKRIAQLEEVIDEILGNDDPNDDDAAIPKMAEKQRLEAEMATLDTNIADAGSLQGQLTEAKALIDSKIGEMKIRLQRLRDTDSGAKAKEEAANALRAVRGHLSQDHSGSVDSALARAEKRGAIADVSLERAMSDVRAVGGADEATILAKRAIAERRRALAAKQAGEATSVAAS